MKSCSMSVVMSLAWTCLCFGLPATIFLQACGSQLASSAMATGVARGVATASGRSATASTCSTNSTAQPPAYSGEVCTSRSRRVSSTPASSVTAPSCAVR